MSEQHLKDETRPSSRHVDDGDHGYTKSLKHRHVNMIAIGTGLFLGADGRIADAGPSLSYAVCGVFAFLVVRALGQLGPGSEFTARMSRSQVPYGGILLTSGICVLGVGLNFVVPAEAFEIILDLAAISILATWGMIMLCHPLFRHKTQKGELTRPGYRLPGSPWTEMVTPAFLASVLVLVYADGGAGRTTVLCLPLIVAALVAGWYAIRGRLARPSTGTGA
ncbi:hypothetical protein ABZ357_28195 [Streptomyces sp. NPDC005917]|uniref:hypothetical protein n=1 Tax=unclassified Streptomyces TaxID=2593676 RepID=UPI00340CAAAF